MFSKLFEIYQKKTKNNININDILLEINTRIENKAVDTINSYFDKYYEDYESNTSESNLEDYTSNSEYNSDQSLQIKNSTVAGLYATSNVKNIGKKLNTEKLKQDLYLRYLLGDSTDSFIDFISKLAIPYQQVNTSQNLKFENVKAYNIRAEIDAYAQSFFSLLKINQKTSTISIYNSTILTTEEKKKWAVLFLITCLIFTNVYCVFMLLIIVIIFWTVSYKEIYIKVLYKKI